MSDRIMREAVTDPKMDDLPRVGGRAQARWISLADEWLRHWARLLVESPLSASGPLSSLIADAIAFDRAAAPEADPIAAAERRGARMKLAADNDRLRAALTATLAMLERVLDASVRRCDRCTSYATRNEPGAFGVWCDEHAPARASDTPESALIREAVTWLRTNAREQ